MNLCRRNTTTEIAVWSDEYIVDGNNGRQAIWIVRHFYSSGGMWRVWWETKARYFQTPVLTKKDLPKLTFRTKSEAMQWLRQEGIFKVALKEIKSGK